MVAEALIVVNLPLEVTEVPIAVPSIFPPLMSTVVNSAVPVTSMPAAYKSFASRSLRVWSVAEVRHLSVPKLYKNWALPDDPEYTCIPAVVSRPPLIISVMPSASRTLIALMPNKFSDVICSAVSKIVLSPSTIKEPRIYTVPLLFTPSAAFESS